MGKFTDEITVIRRAFRYHDLDSDTLTLWRPRTPDTAIRVSTSHTEGVHIAPEDFAEFQNRLAQLTKNACTTCNGEGYV
jgi:hypothetical protein